jgi:hypothetical protein
MTMQKLKSIAALLCAAAALAGCEKIGPQDITGPDPVARIKFYNFGVNAPAVNFYANDTKMTAVSSTTGSESTSGVAYAGVGNAGLYSAITPGQYTVSGRISATTDKDLPISSIPVNIAAGKLYSVFQSGVYNATAKSVDGFVVEDNFPTAPDFTTARVRFVNAIHNSAPMMLIARDSTTKQEYPVGGTIAYKSAGEFVNLPAGIYTLSTRTQGSSTNVIVRTDVGFGIGRVYTIASRGDMTITSATPAPDRRPSLDLTTNF